MSAPLFLVAFSVAVSIAGSKMLTRASWTQRSPRWGIWAWQALTLSVTSAVLLAAVTLALPALPIRADVATVFGTTPFRVAEHYTTPAGTTLAVGAACLGAVLLVRITASIALQLGTSDRLRRRQVAALQVIGIPHPDGYIVVAHDTPLVYCLPGRRRTVVVTTSAIQLLEPRELHLVLAHERTHLRARHDLALALARGLDRAFYGHGVFRAACRQIETLVEMQADDSARAAGDRHTLARALVTLCSGPTPRSTLAAADTDALLRVRRLVAASAEPVTRPHGAILGFATAALLGAPALLALAPAIEATITNCWAVTHSPRALFAQQQT